MNTLVALCFAVFVLLYRRSLYQQNSRLGFQVKGPKKARRAASSMGWLGGGHYYLMSALFLLAFATFILHLFSAYSVGTACNDDQTSRPKPSGRLYSVTFRNTNQPAEPGHGLLAEWCAWRSGRRSADVEKAPCPLWMRTYVPVD